MQITATIFIPGIASENLAARLRDASYDVIDFSVYELTPEDDYPDFVIPLGQAVAAAKVDRGLAFRKPEIRK